MLYIIWYIIVGFIVGLIARAIMPGAQHLGFIMNTLLGIAGSIAGGFIGRLFSKPEPGAAFHPAGFIMSDHRRDHSAVYLDKISGLRKAFTSLEFRWSERQRASLQWDVWRLVAMLTTDRTKVLLLICLAFSKLCPLRIQL